MIDAVSTPHPFPLPAPHDERTRAFRLAFAALLASITTAFAQDPVADFYRGKQMQMVIRSQAGAGGYDSYARLLARHIGRHIPGNPRVQPINMPGGGGIVAANFIANVAPKDGTILAIVSQGNISDQSLGLNNS